MNRSRALLAFTCGLAAALVLAPRAIGAADRSAADLAAARVLFEANLDAIRRKDRDAYLACYIDSESLARTGPAGIQLGFEGLSNQTAGTAWPSVFDASDLRLVAVQDGVVYGTYRYRVRFGAGEQAGLSERLFVRTPRGWRIAVTSAFPAPPGTPPPPRALVGATLVDGTGAVPVANAVVILRGGRIECAGTREQCPVPAGVDSIDLHGNWIVPGLVDAHVHYSQTGWADGRPDALDLRARYPYAEVQERLRTEPGRFDRCFLCSGVTAVFDVGGYPWTADLEDRNDPAAPRVVSAGPLLSTLDHWLNLPAERQFIYLADETAAREGVRYLAARGVSAVKVWFIATRDRDFGEMSRLVALVGEEARRVGLPLIVHATGLAEAKSALHAGAHLLVHSVWDTLVDEEFIALARERSTVYCPTLTVGDGYTRLFELARSGRRGHPPLIDDPNGCVDTLTRALIESTPEVAADLVDPGWLAARRERPERARIMAANLKRVYQAGIPIAMGTDAGNPLTLHGPSVYAEMEAMQAAGMSPIDVLVASTRGGALAMRRLDEIGTIEAGKAADLIVLAADPTADITNLRTLRSVVRGGVFRLMEELRP